MSTQAMKALQPERPAPRLDAIAAAVLGVEIDNLSPSVVVVRLRGHADDIEQQLWWAVRHDPRFVILDLAGVTSISPAALRSLEEFRRQQCRQGSEVWLTGLQPGVWLALHAANLDSKFTIRDSVNAGP
jgi:anti-anti-sigma factor